MMTRYSPPYIPDAVKRHRLFLLLDENFHKQNFLITGQAAQGKSTLVASYLQQSPGSVLWFHLSSDDRDHTKLFDRLAGGIQQRFGFNKGETGMCISNSILGTEKGVLRHVEGLSIMFQELCSPLIMVLDDFESIDETSSGFQLIKVILNSRFEKLKFFLLSRSMPPFNIPRLKMDHHIFVLDNEDLAFNLVETRLFFSGKPRADAIDIEKIQEITDGWAGGLTLVSESIKQFKQLKHLPDQLSSEVFNFFSQEIYDSLAEPIQEFLMKTSILDIIDLEVVTHVFGSCNALEILTELEKRNLFIQRIESAGSMPEFKYHTLFRDFLLQDLLRKKGSQACKMLNKKAGQFFWEKKDHEQAMSYFIEAQAFSDIVRIIKIKGTDYVINGKMSSLENWICHIPDKMVQHDPWLIFFKTMTRRIKGGKKNIRDFQSAFVLFEQLHDMRGMILSVGYLIEAAVFVRQPSDMILTWIKKGEKYLRQVCQKNRYSWARTLLWQQIGLGYIAGDGNIPKGVSACRNAILLGRQINHPDLILNASITMTFGYVQAGDFVNARQMLLKTKKMTNKGRHPEYRALKSIVDINFALKNGRFEHARQLLARSEADIEKFGLIFLYPGFVEAKALHLVYTKRFDDARQMAEHLNDFSILEGNDFYKGIAHRIKALSFLQEENFVLAEKEIQSALRELDPVKKGDIHHFLAQQLAGIILFGKGDFKAAGKVLIPALEYFEQILSDLSCCEICFAMGLISWHSNEPMAAFKYLSCGLKKAFLNGYLFFPLISEQLLIKALLLMTAYDKIKSFESYVLSLILNCDPVRVFEGIDRVLALGDQGHNSGVVENFKPLNLKPLYKRLLPGIRIETLGKFNVLSNNKILDNKIFEGTRPILLLKSIVLHGSRDIPKEILIDDLWPQASPKAGDKNFKINLHRLRKAIEPNTRKEFGYSYIIQKAGLVSLDPELVTLDVDEFMALGAGAVENEKNNQYKTALEFYEKAVKIYNGDYLSEEPYLEWISLKRKFFKSKYNEFLQKKAMLHEELDQIEKAVETWLLLLEQEPYYEPAYQNLMILYADSGQRNKALDLFQECRSLLKKDLETEPDEQTVGIYLKIKSL
ncbi:BTAD domain-containing putative transcriptional regulator [Desulfobacula phenolica]|uniref:Transcriptional activator domain-containing protein n=1 Tax=Desulfobacula phenolica TaxID=90732 RepID=A0A1H2HXC2_9BACT|nr:BTAD domain-containing putative transcriptional regulator [Desulfobacula phenolica]SDU36531.1 transcriptional activator domain-containing protein [Desulfobacula phenolica]